MNTKKTILLLCSLLLLLLLTGCNCEHTFGPWLQETPATCTSEGKQIRVCAECEKVESAAIPLLDHSFGEGEITTNATCFEDGLMIKKCANCEAQIEESIPAQHNWQEATCIAAKTCTVCNETTGEPIDHSWKSATCTTPKTCTYCKRTEGSSLGHDRGSNGKCTRCGTKLTIDMNTKISAPTNDFAILRGRNSVGLVEVQWTADNDSGKTINYYTVTGYYYNAVGDPAKNDITGKTSYTVKYVGPVAPNGMLLVTDLGYCSTCKYVVIGEITLEYSDGTTDTGWYGHKIYID